MIKINMFILYTVCMNTVVPFNLYHFRVHVTEFFAEICVVLIVKCIGCTPTEIMQEKSKAFTDVPSVCKYVRGYQNDTYKTMHKGGC